MTQPEPVSPPSVTLIAGWRLRLAIVLAIVADVVQMVLFPIFWEGVASPVEDALDLGLAVFFSALLGVHWEFAPSFLFKLVPGVDMAPLWTLAVANVYRKARREALAAASR
jgi:hypothetical protein